MKTALFKPLWEPFTLLPVTEDAGVNEQTSLAVRAVIMLDPGEDEISLRAEDLAEIISVRVDGVAATYTIFGNTIKLDVLNLHEGSPQTAIVEIDRNAVVNYSIFTGECVPGISIDGQGRLKGIVSNIASLTPKDYKFGIKAEWEELTADVIKTWTANPVHDFLSWNFDTLPGATTNGALIANRNFYTLGELKRGQYVEVGIDYINPDGTPVVFALRDVAEMIDGETTFSGLPLNLTMTNNPLTFSGLVPAEAVAGDYFAELYTDEPLAPTPIIIHFRVLPNSFFELMPIQRLRWASEPFLGEIKEGLPSSLFVRAESDSGEPITYSIAAGSRSLPTGLTLASNGEIRGIGPTISIDETITFSVKASSGRLVIEQEFSLDLVNSFRRQNYMTVRLPLSGPIRRAWQGYTSQLLTDLRYRSGDANFPTASPNILLIRGLNSRSIPDLTYDEPFWAIMGPFKVAQVKDSSDNVLYDVIYRELIDPMERAGGFALGNAAIEIPEYYPQDANIKLADASFRNLRYDLVDKVGLNSEPSNTKKLGLNGGEVLDPWMESPQSSGEPIGYIAAGIVGYVPANTGVEIAEDLTYGDLAIGKVVHFDRLRVTDGTTEYFYYLGVDNDSSTIVPGAILAPINLRINGIPVGNLRGSQPRPTITWEAQQSFALYSVRIFDYEGNPLREVTEYEPTSFSYTNAMWVADGSPSVVQIEITAVFDGQSSPALKGSFAIRAGWGFGWGYVYGGEPLGNGLKQGIIDSQIAVSASLAANFIFPPVIEATVEVVAQLTGELPPTGVIDTQINVVSDITDVIFGTANANVEVTSDLVGDYFSSAGRILSPISISAALAGNYVRPQRFATIAPKIIVTPAISGIVTFPEGTGSVSANVVVNGALEGTFAIPDDAGFISASVNVIPALTGILGQGGIISTPVEVISAITGDVVILGQITAVPVTVTPSLFGFYRTIGRINMAPIRITSSIAGVADPTGTMDLPIPIAVAMEGALGTSGTIAAPTSIAATIEGVVGLAGILETPISIAAAMAGSMGMGGTIAAPTSIAATIEGVVDLAGTLETPISIAATIEGVVDLAGTLETPISIAAAMAGSMGMGGTITASTSIAVAMAGIVDSSETIAEITTMTGGREAIVPQTYHQRVAADAFNTALHPIGDPLLPSCAIFTHKMVKDGRWSDPTAWNTGTIPGANATVCTDGFDLIYDVLSDVLIKDIHVNGQSRLTFDPAVQTRLWVDTLAVDGELVIGESSANPIPDSGIVVGGKRVPQCEIVFWQSEVPLATARLGLITAGPVRIHGARKSGHLEIAGSVLAGATSCTLTQNASQAGWKVGDEIAFIGTEWAGTSSTDAQYEGPTQFYGPNQGSQSVFTQTAGFKQNQTEIRTITAVSGTTITWSGALTHNHLVTTDTLPRGQAVTVNPIVTMQTHSYRIRTADASDTVWVGDLTDLQKRAHAMFMFSDDIQIRHAEFKNMGRTASDPSLNGPDNITRYATADTSQPITNVNNQHGRYAIHLHRNGPFFGRKQVVLEGCSAWAPTAEFPIPGWAIVQHDSRAAIHDCVTYNFRGAGFVTELGSETGQWIGNVAAWGRGDSFAINWGYRAESWHNHNGHSGVGFESQARQILQQDNYASGCNQGWLYMQQAVNSIIRVPDGDSLRYRDPITQGSGLISSGTNPVADTYGIEQATVPDFYRNVTWDCSDAFFKAHQQFTDRFDPIPFLFKECHWLNCGRAYHLNNYTFHYYVYDSLWTGHSTTGTTGATLGPVMWANSFVNVKMKRFSNGYTDAGYSIAYQGFWLDVGFEDVTTHFNGSSNLEFGVDPTTRSAWNVMGDAVITGPTSGRTRVWSNITTASLPSIYPAAPFGPDSAERTANPCPAFGADPYVVLLGTQDTTLTPTGLSQYSIRALIVDSLGYRWHGDNQNPESNLILMAPKQTRTPSTPGNMQGTEIARRNGVFNDAGTWKTRAWFNDVDRATGNHFRWFIDFTLSGFDAGFLAANTVDPNATQPPLEFLPETLRTEAIAVPALHTITSAAALSVNENTPLAHELLASIGTVRWAITGGADAAQFEIAYTGGKWILRWAANGTKDFEAPNDVGANNIYDVQVTATDFYGRAVNQAVAVTVANVLEAVTEFSDDFTNSTGAIQNLEDRLGYEFISGTPGKFFIPAGGGAVNTITSTGTTYLRLPDIGRTDNFQIQAKFPTNTNTQIRLALDPTTGEFIHVFKDSNTSLIRVVYRDASNVTTVWAYSNSGSNLVKMDLIGTTFRLFIAGVQQTPSSGGVETIPAPLPVGSRFFLLSANNAGLVNVLDDLYIGPA